jgi:DNA-binding response OmpR family regulator
MYIGRNLKSTLLPMISKNEMMRKILVVDDNTDILIALQELLKFYGYLVITTERGEEVFALIEKHDPDLLILDVMLSGMDGNEICRSIKLSSNYKYLPIIMISAHPNAAETVAIAGANDFVAKPFDIGFLLEKINKNIAHKLQSA